MFFETDIDMLQKQELALPASLFKRKTVKWTTAHLRLWISIGNNMICGDIWHKYQEWYFEIVIRNLRQFWNITSGIYAKYHVQIMLLFVYTTTGKRFVIFTCKYFKLSWNTTALSQSDCRNFSCSSIKDEKQHQIKSCLPVFLFLRMKLRSLWSWRMIWCYFKL